MFLTAPTKKLCYSSQGCEAKTSAKRIDLVSFVAVSLLLLRKKKTGFWGKGKMKDLKELERRKRELDNEIARQAEVVGEHLRCVRLELEIKAMEKILRRLNDRIWA